MFQKNQGTAFNRKRLGHLNLFLDQDIHTIFTHRKGKEMFVTLINSAGIYVIVFETTKQSLIIVWYLVKWWYQELKQDIT